MKWLLDIIHDKQKYLIGLVLFIALSAVSITVTQGQIQLNLTRYPLLILGLILFSILLIILYIQIDQSKINALTDQIKSHVEKSDKEEQSLESSLTTRQYKVYQLILAGKTNKDIMNELYIEKSTLKSHINQIYKKLDITNRRELTSRKIN